MEILAVFLPLLAFVLAFLFGKTFGVAGVNLITCGALIISALISCILFFSVVVGGDHYTIALATWISSGTLSLDWALRIDSLSVTMMCVITIVSACVHVYSVGYMSHDPHRTRFMAYLSLFTFAMLMLVTADNLVQLFFGWEGVGLASYLLIGFWNHKHSANAAAQKAFIVNRVGDLGLVLGIFSIFLLTGSVQFDAIFEAASTLSDRTIDFFGFAIPALTLACLFLFTGAVGKSAQLGLHTWLPDAMEGPTPVSALIHAATMVTAGVFLVARMSPVFEYAPDALLVVTVLGAATAFVAATIGMTQFDIKRVIAYSTMSQLGYMFFALGVSAYSAAMFHLVTHAFFKALLFLGAGSVIHAMSDEQDMRRMGGIWKKIPWTYGFMWIGSLALAGVPFFAGYYSKDLMLEAAWADQSWQGTFAFWTGIVVALMTAFYSFRVIFLTFHGTSRAEQHVINHIHESPRVMLLPLAVLAAGAILSGALLYNGFAGGHHDEVHHAEDTAHETDVEEHGDTTTTIAEEVVHSEESHAVTLHGQAPYFKNTLLVSEENDTVAAAHNVPLWVKLLPAVMGAIGILFAALFYLVFPGIPAKISGILGPIYRFAFRKWYFDELYDALLKNPAWALGRFFSDKGDRGTIDRFGPDGFAKLSARFGGFFSRIQSGFIYHYAFVMMIGLLALVSWVLFAGGVK